MRRCGSLERTLVAEIAFTEWTQLPRPFTGNCRLIAYRRNYRVNVSWSGQLASSRQLPFLRPTRARPRQRRRGLSRCSAQATKVPSRQRPNERASPEQARATRAMAMASLHFGGRRVGDPHHRRRVHVLDCARRYPAVDLRTVLIRRLRVTRSRRALAVCFDPEVVALHVKLDSLFTVQVICGAMDNGLLASHWLPTSTARFT